MRTITICYVLICLAIGTVHEAVAQAEIFALLDSLYARNASFPVKAYRIDHRFKFFHQEDTVHLQARVTLQRDPSDSLFSGKVLIDMDSVWLGYDGSHLMQADEKRSKLTLADAKSHPGTYIQSTLYNNLIDQNFLRPDTTIKQLLRSPETRAYWQDTVIGDTPCVGIFIRLPDENEFSHQQYFFAIAKNTLVTIRKTYSVEFQENTQYASWIYSAIEFSNNLKVDKWDPARLEQYKEVNQYAYKSAEEEDSSADFNFGQIRGKVFDEENWITLREIPAAFTMLDFWYTSCYPCIKSIPLVNTLYQKYKDSGVQVYGINMIDDESKSRDRLKKFMRNNPMAYKTLMIDKRYNALIPLEGYPTLLILDENLQVIYSETGFNENMVEEVSTFLDSRL